MIIEKEYYDLLPTQFFKNKPQNRTLNTEIVVEHFMRKFAQEGVRQDTTLHYHKSEKRTSSFAIVVGLLFSFGFLSKFYIQNK